MIEFKPMLKPYHPLKLPVKINLDSLVNPLTEASFELGQLNGLQKDLPNPTLLISPLTAKEATVSSKIEGTRSTVSDVFIYEAIEKSEYSETIEVFNYRKAMIFAIEALKERKINNSFIKELHSLLLGGARGHKKRGEWRKEQVFIGEKRATIEKATYIPPEAILIPEYMENLEKYILENDEHPLIKIAIIHYQFEAIHPFTDGNGRIGRLLIPLYLYWKGLLFQPILYLSGYFDKYRQQYIDTLHSVDRTQKYETWIEFFLKAVKEQAKDTQNLIERIKSLYRDTHQKLEKLKSPYISKIVDFIFKQPVFDPPALKEFINSSRATALRMIEKMQEFKLVASYVPPGRKRKIFIFKELVDLLQNW